MLTAGSYLHRLETGADGGQRHDLRGALAVYGGSLAYTDQVLALALAPAAGPSTLPVVLPIPAPGRVERVATPQWPADLAAHMNPSAITNQCVAGALATWALMHMGDPRWNHPPPLMGNAIDLYGVAAAECAGEPAAPAADPANEVDQGQRDAHGHHALRRGQDCRLPVPAAEVGRKV